MLVFRDEGPLRQRLESQFQQRPHGGVQGCRGSPSVQVPGIAFEQDGHCDGGSSLAAFDRLGDDGSEYDGVSEFPLKAFPTKDFNFLCQLLIGRNSSPPLCSVPDLSGVTGSAGHGHDEPAGFAVHRRVAVSDHMADPSRWHRSWLRSPRPALLSTARVSRFLSTPCLPNLVRLLG